MVKEKVLLILSGGMDSATLLAKLIKEKNEVYALTFDYGQRHIKEIECAKRLINFYKINNHQIIKTPTLKGSALTGIEDIPEGHYAHESMKKTVVPNRNMVMLSLAVSYAESEGINKIYYGAHAGDHYIYWDCRPSFIQKMNMILAMNDSHNIEIIVPFLQIDKGDIACIGKSLNVPYELTWTCYKGLKEPCGKCGACIERKEAMEKAGMKE